MGIVTAKQSPSLISTLAVLLSAALWGSIWIPLRHVSGAGLSGGWVSLMIYGVPFFIMLPIALVGRAHLGHFGLAALWVGATSGICNTFYAVAVIYGAVGKVVLLFYLNPIWSAILERIVLKTPISRTRIATIAIGFVGMAVLVGDEYGIPLPHGLAEWFAVFASIFWALSLIGMTISGSKELFPKIFFQFFFGLVSSVIILALQLFPDQLLPKVSQLTEALPWSVAAVIVWIIPGIGLGFWAVGRMSPTRAAILFMLEAVVGVVSAAILTDEPFGWREIVGGLMILGAGLLDVVMSTGKSDRGALADEQYEGAQ